MYGSMKVQKLFKEHADAIVRTITEAQEQQEVETALSADLPVRTIPDGLATGCSRGNLFAVRRQKYIDQCSNMMTSKE